MKIFTIDAENNISVFPSKKEAAGASPTPFDSFGSQSELTELAADWPTSRLVEIWNGIPGVTPVTRFTNGKAGIERIWKAIQNLGGGAAKPAEPSAEGQPRAKRVVRTSKESPAEVVPA